MSNRNILPIIGSASEKTQGTGSTKPITIVVLTQAEYDALSSPDANTLYVIAG